MDKELIIKELAFLKANLIHYLRYISEEDGDWSPTKESFSLNDLACHLYSLPKAYSKMMSGDSEENVLQIWGGPWDRINCTEQLKDLLINGMEELETIAGTFTQEEFFKKRISWSFGEPFTPSIHLYTLISHMYHHRGQLHLYLKMLGKNVDTNTIYSTDF